MPACHRYAVFFVPEGALYNRASAWLGWDSARGCALPSAPVVPGLTDRPRRYGFHATLKPPFRLAEGSSPEDLADAMARIAENHAPVDLPALQIETLGRFLALTPSSPCPAVLSLAGRVVTDLDPFRAPLTDAEITRRRASRLSAVQEAHLARWGYPFVLDQFRFHMTLTGPVARDALGSVRQAIADHFGPVLAAPVRIADLALMGEDDSGHFHLLRRFPLVPQPR